jgi:hypothetical protein
MTIPKPTLQFEDAGGGTAALEKPVNVLIGEVKEGTTALGPDLLATFGLFSYRRATSGAGLEIWDDGAKQWKPDPGTAVDSIKPSMLANKQGDPNPWQGIVVAAGGKDSSGQPQFAKAKSGYPSYSFRAWFATKDGTDKKLSDPTDNLQFVGSSDKNLMVVGPGDDEKPEEATQSRVQLKDTSLNVIGQLLIERDSPGARVTVSNAAGASVVLHPDGHIELKPAAGKNVVVSGDLETERITYQPSGGGPKRELV